MSITVFMTAWRSGIDYHRLANNLTADGNLMTACGRFVNNGRDLRAGFLMPDHDAVTLKAAKPCVRCWPGGRS